jgi:hypothetical protein
LQRKSQIANITLPLGPVGFIMVNVIPCMLFVIQEMQEKDTLCGNFEPLTLQFKATVGPVIFCGKFIWIFQQNNAVTYTQPQ